MLKKSNKNITLYQTFKLSINLIMSIIKLFLINIIQKWISKFCVKQLQKNIYEAIYINNKHLKICKNT